MNRTMQGILSIFLGFLMLGWFVYSIMDPPTRPSETYAMDWVLVVRLIGAAAGLVGGLIMLVVRK